MRIDSDVESVTLNFVPVARKFHIIWDLPAKKYIVHFIKFSSLNNIKKLNIVGSVTSN